METAAMFDKSAIRPFIILIACTVWAGVAGASGNLDLMLYTLGVGIMMLLVQVVTVLYAILYSIHVGK